LPGGFFIAQDRLLYSPLPKRRDDHPARRGWLSVVSEAGSAGAEAGGG